MLKKLVLFVFLNTCFIGGTFAQQYDNDQVVVEDVPVKHRSQSKIDINKIRLGAYLAPDISWLHPTTSKSDDNKYYVSSTGNQFGFLWGLMGEYYFAENYGVYSGFNLNTTGGNLNTRLNSNLIPDTTSNTVINSDFSYNLQFFEIPIGLKLRSDEVNKNGLRIFGQIGLTFGFNFSSKVDYNVVYNNGPIRDTMSGENEKLKGTLAIPALLIQMNIGAGIEYPIRQKLFFYMGLFFNNGFYPDATDPGKYQMGYKGSFDDAGTRLNSLAIRLGLFF